MNKTRIYCLLLCSVLSVATLVAQSKAEYFIDHDPGCGRATVVSISADAAQVNVPTSGLAAGWHVLGLRALGSRASQTYTHRFFIPEQTQVTELSDVEYFLDTDPGRDNAVKVPFTTGQTAFSFDLTNTDDLSDGIHLVGVRAKYGSRWSQTYTHLFFVTHAQAATELSGVEYWLDTDPGLGNATAYDFTAGQTEFALDAVLPEDLAEGSHLLGIRARYGDNWSQTYTHLFLHTVAHNVPVVVEAVEAYWDADMANPIEVPFDQVGDTAYIKNFDFDTQALSFGVHYLSIRGKINGVWSILSRYEICKNAVPAFEILNEDICVGDEVLILDMTSDVQPETTYKWDMDSNGSAEYTDKSDIVHTYNQAGKYTITLTVQTAEGCESSYSQEIYVHAKVAPSVSIDRSKSSICAGESVTFTANAVNAGEHPVFTWLRNNTVIAGITGTTLELSDLADNDQIQVQVTGDNPCADVKTATSSVLTQRVYPLPEVEITLASVYYTDDKAFSLSAYGTPSGGTFYINDVEAKLFNPKNNPVGTYNVRYVVTNSNNCTAEAEMSFQLKEHGNATITVLSADETMGSVTGGGTYADGTKVTLTATPNDGYHFVQWQDGVTTATREITVNGDATYTATFAEDAPATPTVSILSQWYDVENKIVFCMFFETAPCYDVYFVGTCNNWAQGDGNTPSFDNCQKFSPVPGYDGWFAVEVPYADGAQGKPIQAESDGTFNWMNQAGDPDAWTNLNLPGTQALWLEYGFDGEANVYIPSAGTYIYSLSYWKNHGNACVSMQDYTINLYAPNPCDGMQPAVIGDFNSWMENLPMALGQDAQGRPMYSCTVQAKPMYAFKFREVNDNSWNNQLLYLDTESGEWKEFSNFVLGENTTVTYDFSDGNLYRYAQCYPENYRYTVTFLDWNETVLKTDVVINGNAATAPTDPTRDGYIFIGWDKDFSSVTADMTVTALYEPEPEPFVPKLDITIDGDFSDWSTIPQSAVATAAADASSAYESLYLMKWAMDVNNIFFYIEYSADADDISKINILLNSDNNTTTGYNTGLWLNAAADFMYEKAPDKYSSAVPYNFSSDDQTAWAWTSTGISGTIVACNPVDLSSGHRAIEGKIIKENLPAEVASTIRVGVYSTNATWKNTGCLPQYTAAGASPMLEVNLYNGVATDLFQTGIANGSVECNKLIRNGVLYLLRDGKIYTVHGTEVR